MLNRGPEHPHRHIHGLSVRTRNAPFCPPQPAAPSSLLELEVFLICWDTRCKRPRHAKPAPDISLFTPKIAINNRKMAGWKLRYEKHPDRIPGASPYYNTPGCCNTVLVSGESGKTWWWVCCTTVCANSPYLSKGIERLEKTGWPSQTGRALIGSNFVCNESLLVSAAVWKQAWEQSCTYVQPRLFFTLILINYWWIVDNYNCLLFFFFPGSYTWLC